jgi:outer membrane biosynthesis protein TonB
LTNAFRQDEMAAVSLQEDAAANEYPVPETCSTLPFTSKGHRNHSTNSYSLSGSIDRLETPPEAEPPRSRKPEKSEKPVKPEKPVKTDKPVDPKVPDPSPKVRYETAMVHMSDCPTIRSDCVSSNQVVVYWTVPGD